MLSFLVGDLKAMVTTRTAVGVEAAAHGADA